MTRRANVRDASPGKAGGAHNLFEILFEAEELLVVNKPADLVCHPTKQDGRSSLVDRVRLYLGPESRARLVNRLDRETSGVVVVAKSAEAAGELGRAWESRAVEKTYLAIVHGHLHETGGVVDAPLGRDEASPVAIKNCVRPDGVPARTEFRVERSFRRGEREFSLLRVVPHTGRKHQIRIHLAHVGHPIVGDKIYGGDERIYLDFAAGRLSETQRARLILSNHALHAAAVRLEWRGTQWSFEAAASPEFVAFAAA